MEIVLRVSTFVQIAFLVLGRKVQTLYFVYIACAGERLLLVMVVVCRERSDRNNNNRSDLATRFGPYQLLKVLLDGREDGTIWDEITIC